MDVPAPVRTIVTALATLPARFPSSFVDDLDDVWEPFLDDAAEA